MTNPKQPATISDPVRTLASLLLFIHLFFIGTALVANRNAPILLDGILRFSRPYTQLLNWELDNSPYYLTHDTFADVDHLVDVLPAGADENDEAAWENVIPGSGNRAALGYKRLQRLGTMLEYFREDEELAGAVCQAVCRLVIEQTGNPPTMIRGRRHVPQTWFALDSGTPAERDPDSAQYVSEIYRADVIVSNGSIQVVKRAGRAQEAIPDSAARTGVTASQNAAGSDSSTLNNQ